MQILLQFLTLIVFSSGIFSCSGNQSHVVGYLNPSAERKRFVTEGNFMKERLQELGINTITMAAGDDDAVQLAQGFELLEKGVDLLVIAPVNGITIAPLVREAINRGVKVVAYNRLISNADYDLFITGNNEDNARLFCEAALSRKPTGNYVILAGDRFDRNGFELKQHIDKILAPHVSAGRINILYESYVEGWNLERAYFELEQVVSAYGTDIDAIIACNDPMGLGALQLMKKFGAANGVVITGQDATLQFAQGVYNGDLTMTIYHPHRELGHKTAELVSRILSGEKTRDMATAETFNGVVNIPTYKVNSVAVTRENIVEVLVKSGEYTIEQLRGETQVTGSWE